MKAGSAALRSTHKARTHTHSLAHLDTRSELVGRVLLGYNNWRQNEYQCWGCYGNSSIYSP